MYYKGTKEQCEKYNAFVVKLENYKGVTNKWDEVVELYGNWYILKHEKYEAAMELVNELPKQEEIV